MKRALVASKAKVGGMVQGRFSGAPPQTLSYFALPIRNPGGATVEEAFVSGTCAVDITIIPYRPGLPD